MTGSTVSEIWGTYHGLFEDTAENTSVEPHFTVSESYLLAAPHLDAEDFGCAAGDSLYFTWTGR